MIRIFLLVLISLVFTLPNVAQNHCGTQMNKEAFIHFLKNKEIHYNYAQREDLIYVPLKFHLVADVEGNGRASFEAILDQVCDLNAGFEPFGFKFYLKDGKVNNIDNNTIYFNASTAAGVGKMVAQKNDFGANALNIFVTENAGSGIGVTLGYYTFNQDWIVLKKSVTTNGNQRGWVLMHEIGHFFSLPHTFNGWDNVAWDGVPITSPTSPGGVLSELADGSNCETAGDMICDTPADYNLGFGWDGCSKYDGGCTDITGALLDPDEENTMGYFIGCDDYHFSDEQMTIMSTDFNTNRRSYLRVSYEPTDLPITESPSLIAPADDTTTPFYNGVELSWTAVPNAKYYWLELTQGLTKETYIVDHNKIFFTDLKEDKSYRWRVLPFSDIYTCADSTPTWKFRTGTGTTSTDEANSYSKNLQIFPNPSTSSSINVVISGQDYGLGNVNIFDLNGRSIYQNKFSKNKGEHILSLENLDVQKGFYILRVEIGDKTITQKVIFND